jgi:hypothetical protein
MNMVDVSAIPSLDFEAGMAGSATQESVAGIICVAVWALMGV